MSKYTGGYKLISLHDIDIFTLNGQSIEGIFNSILTTKKRIVLTDVVIDGIKQNDIPVSVHMWDDLSGCDIFGVPEYNITIDEDDVIHSFPKYIPLNTPITLTSGEVIEIVSGMLYKVILKNADIPTGINYNNIKGLRIEGLNSTLYIAHYEDGYGLSGYIGDDATGESITGIYLF